MADYRHTDNKRAQGKNQFPAQPTKKALQRLTNTGPSVNNRHSDWFADVAKVERCGSKAYKSGEGYNTEFEYSEAEQNKRCLLTARGNHEGLTLSLALQTVHKGPSPQVLVRSNFPDEANLITIRLFDQSRSMDIRLEPKPKSKFASKARAEGDYWSTTFAAHNVAAIENAKKMLRRVENVTLEMPDAWFKYRNYFTRTPNIGDEADDSQEEQPSVAVGRNRVELGGGHSITFTGCLASLEWLKLSGHERIRPTHSPIEEEAVGTAELADPEAPVTRARAAKLGEAFSHSRLQWGTEKAKGAKKQKAAEKRKAKLDRRAGNRAKAAAAKYASRDLEMEEEEVEEESLVAAQQLQQDMEAQLTALATNQASNQAETTSSSNNLDEGSQAVQSDRDSDADETAYEVRGIQDQRVNSQGVTEYLIDWKPIRGREFTPSWEPENLVSQEAIQAYQYYSGIAAARGGRGRGRGRGPRRSKGRSRGRG